VTPYYEQSGITIYHGDCREILPALNLHEGAVIVTDPPYGTGGWRRADSGNGDDPTATLVREAWDDGCVDWLALAPAIVPVIAFWPAQFTAQLLAGALATGRTKHCALYMQKHDPKPQVAGRVRWSMEPIWVLSIDGFLLFGGDDVVGASTPRLGRDTDANGHPYQKPESVMQWVIAKLMPCDDPVVDPFMGSGTTLVAAKRLRKQRALGIEREERYCEIAAKRLQQEALPLEVA
jgi:site-specific DNA-methyltransferase (adenine-specific)